MNDEQDDDQELQNRAISTIRSLIPADAKKRVDDTYRKFNSSVRHIIRHETGFKLSDETSKDSVTIRIVEGFPLEIAQVIDRYPDVVWRLILMGPELAETSEGLEKLLSHWAEGQSVPDIREILGDRRPSVENTRAVTETLLKFLSSLNLTEEIRAIDADILGIYRIRNSTIHLYWMAIALIAAKIRERIEDLTVVVLAHELAHAYTHIGMDIGGARWISEGFAKSDRGVVEGLAQTYTKEVARKLTSQYPRVITAYQKLLELQSEVYTAQEAWLPNGIKRRAEIVRHAMLRARRMGVVSRSEWVGLLSESAATLEG